ncbi:MAG: US12 family protein [Clostridia bacterium]|nr:US12 family protein [Clostridia bacterium]
MERNHSTSNKNGGLLSSRNRKAARMNGADTITASAYNLLIGGMLLYGFIANALIVWLGGDFFASLASEHYAIFIIGYFVLCLAGTIISLKSQKPLISFLGYNLVVVPIGALLAVALPFYYISDILLAIVTTGAVTAIMMILGATFPRTFAKLGRTLLISLFVSLLVNTVALIFGYSGNLFNWIFVAIFSLYIGYDWQKAQMYPKTADNAIDSALDLYLDIINLFVRLLSIISKNRD